MAEGDEIPPLLPIPNEELPVNEHPLQELQIEGPNPNANPDPDAEEGYDFDDEEEVVDIRDIGEEADGEEEGERGGRGDEELEGNGGQEHVLYPEGSYRNLGRPPKKIFFDEGREKFCLCTVCWCKGHKKRIHREDMRGHYKKKHPSRPEECNICINRCKDSAEKRMHIKYHHHHSRTSKKIRESTAHKCF